MHTYVHACGRPAAIPCCSGTNGLQGNIIFAAATRTHIPIPNRVVCETKGPDGKWYCPKTPYQKKLEDQALPKQNSELGKDLNDIQRFADKNNIDLLPTIEKVLKNYEQYKSIADSGYNTIKTRYSKEKQWQDFIKLCE